MPDEHIPNWLRPKLDPAYSDSADYWRTRALRAEAEVERMRSAVRRSLHEAADTAPRPTRNYVP